jgi:hypothetical protein
VVQPAKNYNDDVINFYDEQLVPRADMVYRFAFAASLNLDSASRLVRQTFEEVASDAQRLERGGTASLDCELLSICWRLFKKGGSKDLNLSKSQVVQVLKDLSVEERVILVGTDVLGIGANDMMKIVNVEGVSFRRNLAKARSTLLVSKLEM